MIRYTQLGRTNASVRAIQLASVAAYLSVAGCGSATRTQTIIQVQADSVVRNDANEIRVEVRDASGAITLLRSINPQASDFAGFPLDFPIDSRSDDDRVFEFRASAINNRRQADGAVLVTTLAENRVRTGFRRGEVLRFTLWLLSGCRCNVETQRCEPDSNGDLIPECVAQTIDVVPTDASVEAGLDAAPNTTMDSAAAGTDTSVALVTDASDGAADTNRDDAGAFAVDVAVDAGLMCSVSQRLCENQCVSLDSPLACGASCSRCEGLAGGDAICENGSCGVRCATGTPDRCPNACVNLADDRENCGTCGNACATGLLCVNRNCTSPLACSRTQDPVCTGMSYCNLATNMCAPGCDGRSGQCPSGTTCDRTARVCNCNLPNRMCGGVCAICPTGGQITSTDCAGTSCLVATCRNGYQPLAPDRASCVDIDECATNNGGCGAGVCTNSQGGFSCSCGGFNRRCGTACVSCSDDWNATAHSCDGNACIVGACQNGYTVNASRSGCVSTGLPPGSFTLNRNRSLTTRPTGATGLFGQSVALSPDGLTLAIGLNSDTEIYLFSRASVAANFDRLPAQTLVRPTDMPNFGRGIAFSNSGLLLAVGGTGGGVQLFSRTSLQGSFTSGQLLGAPEGSIDFGVSVAFSGDDLMLAVGDPRASPGTVHFFLRASATTDFPATSSQLLSAPTGSQDFGRSLAFTGGGLTLIVGDPDYAAASGGAVHLFNRASVVAPFATIPSQTLPAVTGGGGSGATDFGVSVAVTNNGLTLAVGDAAYAPGRPGGVHIFTRASVAANFIATPVQTLISPPSGESFGNGIALNSNGSELFVGDNGSTVGSGTSRGVVFAFTVTP